MKPMRLAAALSALFCGANWAGAQGAGQKQYFGTFDTVQGSNVHMTMNDKSTGDWTIAPDAPIGTAKKSFTLANVLAGDRAYVWVSPDGVIHKIQLVSMVNPKKAGGSAAASGGGQGSAPPAKGAGSKTTVQNGKGTSVAGASGSCPAGSKNFTYVNGKYHACLTIAQFPCPAAYGEFQYKSGVTSCGSIRPKGKASCEANSKSAVDTNNQTRCQIPQCRGQNVIKTDEGLFHCEVIPAASGKGGGSKS